MRVISDDPEFTWNGTLGIVIGFAVFGFAQANVRSARTNTRRFVLTASRLFGGISMLPLFVAAGAQMAPTVVCGALALAHPTWRRRTRGALVAIATIPVLFVVGNLWHTFGLSLQIVVGVGGLLAIYIVVIWAARSTFEPRPDGGGLSRRMSLALVGAGMIALAIPLALGGIK
jgi:hypothetical protein